MEEHGKTKPVAGKTKYHKGDSASEGGQEMASLSQKYRVYKSGCIYLSTILYGVMISTIGPTLLNLEVLMNTDLHHLSMALMVKGFGFLSGSLLVGLVLDLINHEFFFFITTVIQGVFVALAPCTGSIYGFVASMFVVGFVGGILAAGGQAYIIRLWGGTKWKQPTTQAFHTVFSTGAIFGPLLARPFLVDISPGGAETVTLSNTSSMTPPTLMTLPDALTDSAMNDSDADSISTALASPVDVSTVVYPYVITGSITLASSLLFLAVFIRERKPFLTRKQPKTTASQKTTKGGSCTERISAFSLAILVLFTICQLCFAVQEHVPGNFLAAFVIRGLGWDVIGGATISAVHFGCMLAGRLVGIPVSMVLSPTTMLLLNMPLTTASFVLLCFVPYLPVAFTYISVGMAAFAMSSSTPTLYLWCSQYIPITGKVAAIVTAGYSVGDMGGPPLTTHLMKTFSPMFVVYVPLVASIIELSLFIVLNVIVKCCPRPIAERIIAYQSVEIAEPVKS